MDRVPQTGAIGKLPVMELTSMRERFTEPVLMRLPEKRLREVATWPCKGSLADNRLS